MHRAFRWSSCRRTPDRSPAERRYRSASTTGCSLRWAEVRGQLNGMNLPPVVIGVPVIFAVVGSVFVFLGPRYAAGLRRFRRTAARASGVVLDLVLDRAGPRSSSSLVYFPVVRYWLPDGRVVDFRSPQGSSLLRCAGGSRWTCSTTRPTRRTRDWRGSFPVAASTRSSSSSVVSSCCSRGDRANWAVRRTGGEPVS